MRWLIKMIAVVTMLILAARFTLFYDQAEFTLFSEMTRRYAPVIIGVWLAATVLGFLIIAGMEKDKQEKAANFLTKANYVLAAVILGGLFAGFKLRLLV